MLWNKASGAGGFSVPRGEAVFTAIGDTSWTVPAGVTSISVVAVGGGGAGSTSTSAGGGGSGGDLRYYNNLSVTPGETLTITVGIGGVTGTNSGDGGFSGVYRSGGATTLLEAAGGGGGTTAAPRPQNGTSSTIGGSIGGGDGGAGATASGAVQCGGGGGAGGYSGAGGAGAFLTSGNASDGTGGAGGGGGGGGDTDTAGNGGGVGLFGVGEDGLGGLNNTANGFSGTGGSYGDGGLDTDTTGAQSFNMIAPFGNGGGGDDNGIEASNAGQGGVRIVWPGTTRSFPSTDVWMSNVLTTVIETQSASSTLTIPSSAQAGDLAILMSTQAAANVSPTPTGWTTIFSQFSVGPSLVCWYRILQSGDAGAGVSVVQGSAELILFRKANGTVSSVNVSGATVQQSTSKLTTQTQSAASATAPFIVIGAFASTAVTINSYDMYFTGGIAGSGNLEASAVFSNPNGDVNRRGYMRFRIYDEAPATDVSVVNFRDVGTASMGSFIIEVS